MRSIRKEWRPKQKIKNEKAVKKKPLNREDREAFYFSINK